VSSLADRSPESIAGHRAAAIQRFCRGMIRAGDGPVVEDPHSGMIAGET